MAASFKKKKKKGVLVFANLGINHSKTSRTQRNRLKGRRLLQLAFDWLIRLSVKPFKSLSGVLRFHSANDVPAPPRARQKCPPPWTRLEHTNLVRAERRPKHAKRATKKERAGERRMLSASGRGRCSGRRFFPSRRGADRGADLKPACLPAAGYVNCSSNQVLREGVLIILITLILMRRRTLRCNC